MSPYTCILCLEHEGASSITGNAGPRDVAVRGQSSLLPHLHTLSFVEMYTAPPHMRTIICLHTPLSTCIHVHTHALCAPLSEIRRES